MKAVCSFSVQFTFVVFLEKSWQQSQYKYLIYNLWNFAAYKYNVTHVCVDAKFVVPEI